ncbi:hypothetical protein SeMB42_g02319 [Synchytrium endobioticum]|uniref:Uncharacterized protein n=1 Tax=Synchytrium endobioticum TaxID=286115 RepID=A0A507DFA9_9FUNG|nr:hypothetical protein SeLEV6574_g03112 [Synchytrium endobioticum]TPX50226.1 hypothetical protein SeMB42_g02319 [Synchytrium endobioticum]
MIRLQPTANSQQTRDTAKSLFAKNPSRLSRIACIHTWCLARFTGQESSIRTSLSIDIDLALKKLCRMLTALELLMRS